MYSALVTGALPPEALERLNGLGLQVITRGASDLVDEAVFIEAIKDVEVYISGGYETATRAVLEAANVLKLIVFLGTDCRAYIDVPAANRKGIKVCATPGANALSVAEFTVGLIIDAQRRISWAAASIGSDFQYASSHTAYGRTLGLIGFGHIGLRVAKMCSSAFGMKVNYWTRSGEKPEAKKIGAQFVELDELLASSNIVSIHVPSEAGTMLDSVRLGKLKPGSTLINTSSASLCEPRALLDALQRDELLYMAFDGFYGEKESENEPAIKSLRELIPKRILVTPHVAWRTFEADLAAYEMAICSVSDLVHDLPLRNLVEGGEAVAQIKVVSK